MKLPGGEKEHQVDDPQCAQCAACDPGWPQPHAEVTDHCCPGWVHAETNSTGEPATPPKVIYYCEMCYEDDLR
jgi:hypothetical protein